MKSKHVSTKRPFSVSVSNLTSPKNRLKKDSKFITSGSRFAGLTSRSFWQNRTVSSNTKRDVRTTSGVHRRKNENIKDYELRIQKYKEHQDELNGLVTVKLDLLQNAKDEIENLDRWEYNNRGYQCNLKYVTTLVLHTTTHQKEIEETQENRRLERNRLLQIPDIDCNIVDMILRDGCESSLHNNI